jgi:hypothetical protein
VRALLSEGLRVQSGFNEVAPCCDPAIGLRDLTGAGGQHGLLDLFRWTCASGWSRQSNGNAGRAGGRLIALEYASRRRSTGCAGSARRAAWWPGRSAAGRRRSLASTENWLLEQCRGRDFTLRGLIAEVAERGLQVDYRTVQIYAGVVAVPYLSSRLAYLRQTGGGSKRMLQLLPPTACGLDRRPC